MIRLLPLILIAALLTGCSKPNSKRIRTMQLSSETMVANAVVQGFPQVGIQDQCGV